MAVKQLPGTKAPGPDGLQLIFLHRCWNIMGEDITRLVLSFLNGDASIEAINSTYICLIPKKKSPELVSDYRPIGLCNTLYKVMSKVLANRLKRVLSSVIDESQSAFVPGRLITDNAIVSIELFHAMQSKKKQSVSYMGLKLDLSKAFDRVDWYYLRTIMERMHFPMRFIHLIMQCITTASLSVLVNGVPTDPFKPTRGIRQGDPISPFLFLICAEGLSSLIRHEASCGRWNGIHFGDQSPKITHLLFADDSLLFLEASKENAITVKRVLDEYSSTSGQQVNLGKSSAYLSKNIDETVGMELCNILGVSKGAENDRYLGLPFLIGRTKREIFQYIEDRVRKKITGWKEKFLSPSGKEILIKSVLQAIPNYVTQCFLLPGSVCDKITSLIRQFWWSSSGKEKFVAWLSWDKACLPKGAGGMGFQDIRGFNLAMIAKQGWRMIQSQGTLVARVLKAKYFPHNSFMEAKCGSRPSYLWRSLLRGREVLELGLPYRLDRGENVCLWEDPWIPKPYSFLPCCVYRDLLPEGCVSDLIDPISGSWNVNLLNQLFLPYDVEAIQSIHLGPGDLTDVFIWHHTSHGRYTVKSGYHTFMQAQRNNSARGQPANDQGNLKLWTRIWSMTSLPKIRVFLWRALHCSLPTGLNLHRRIPDIVPDCSVCLEGKNEFHCLISCEAAKSVWEESFPILAGWCVRTFQSVVWWALDTLDRQVLCYFSVLCWLIWKNRCTRQFEGTSLSARQIITNVAGLSAEILDASIVPSSVLAKPPPLNGDWHLPPDGSYAINVDAAYGKGGNRSCGIIIRDHLGAILHALLIPLPSGVEVLHGELLAVLRGLEAAKEYGYRSVILWSDSLTAIRLLHSDGAPLQPLETIILDCLSLTMEFVECSLFFTCRENNYPTHHLARLGLSFPTSFYWGPNPPPHVIDSAIADIYE